MNQHACAESNDHEHYFVPSYYYVLRLIEWCSFLTWTIVNITYWLYSESNQV